MQVGWAKSSEEIALHSPQLPVSMPNIRDCRYMLLTVWQACETVFAIVMQLLHCHFLLVSIGPVVTHFCLFGMSTPMNNVFFGRHAC